MIVNTPSPRKFFFGLVNLGNSQGHLVNSYRETVLWKLKLCIQLSPKAPTTSLNQSQIGACIKSTKIRQLVRQWVVTLVWSMGPPLPRPGTVVGCRQPTDHQQYMFSARLLLLLLMMLSFLVFKFSCCQPPNNHLCTFSQLSWESLLPL